jgi:septal ring factor EnvC (AmiA/AmiB activator)
MSELNYTEKLEAKIEDLEDDLRLEKSEKEDLESEIDRLESKIEELEDKLSEAYNLDKLESELNRLDTFWNHRFTEDELKLLPSIKQKIINIFLYG